jgi:hypothetical protein
VDQHLHRTENTMAYSRGNALAARRARHGPAGGRYSLHPPTPELLGRSTWCPPALTPQRPRLFTISLRSYPPATFPLQDLDPARMAPQGRH